MPQQIVTGEDAQAVADFVAKYSGGEIDRPTRPSAGRRPGRGHRGRRRRRAGHRRRRRRVGAPGRRSPVLDLKSDPRGPGPGPGGARAPRRSRGPRRAPRRRRPPARAPAAGRGGPRAPELRLGPDRRGEALGRGRRGADRRDARARRRDQADGGELAEVEARRDELAATLPNLPSPDAPDGEEGDGVTLREVGDAARVRLRGARPPRPRHAARLDRDGEGRRGVGIALRVSDRRPRDGRAGAHPLRRRPRPRRGLRAGRAAGPGARRRALRHRATSPASAR